MLDTMLFSVTDNIATGIRVWKHIGSVKVEHLSSARLQQILDRV
jgi:hypothetical protein